ncbi:MAG: glycosyltransferase [Lentisphaeria bacterium]|nr:glycosyltransferase [Lentisphaeria bacterium]
MTISVVIAAFCGEEFIGEQIRSLLGQSLPPDEIIITDDSPDERMMEVVAEFLPDPRIRCFRNEKQLGVNGNFEKALSLATGEIIFFCDQDDVWKSDKIAKMVAALEKSPEADGVFCNSSAVNGQLVPLGFSLWQMRGFTGNMQKKFVSGRQLEVFLKRVTCSTHNIAIRRRVLEYALPFPPLDPFYIDTFLGMFIAAHGKWVVLDEELTFYRVHGSNLSSPRSGTPGTQCAAYRRSRSKKSFSRRVEIAGELLRRLPDDLPVGKKEKIAAFARHYAVRDGYSSSFFIRALQIAGEVMTLRYLNYSGSWKSIAADLFLFR